MIWEEGRRVVRPKRFGCSPARAQASYDRQYPGTFNARMDSLEDFWLGEFGYTHAIVMASQFYEAADYYDYTHATRGEKDVDRSIELVFRPELDHDMAIACLYSHWSCPGEPDLWSFAFVTTDPPPEVAAAGYNRCIMPIRPEDIDRWLQPAPDELKRFYDILEARERPYYNHAVVKGIDQAA